MDIFESRYYKIHNFYLRSLGLWPFDDAAKKKKIRTLVIALTISLIVPQAIRLVEDWGKDIDVVIEVVGSLLYFSGSQVKYLSYVRVESQLRYLYEKIGEHWRTFTSRDEIRKLEEYGEAGRSLSIAYLIPINVCLVGYITLPLLPILLDVLDPRNETRPKQFPYFAEYFIDDQRYYYELTLHGWIVCILSVQIYGAFDTTYTQCVQHACGLFAIVEIRLEKALRLSSSDEFASARERDHETYRRTIEAARLHKEALHFVHLIEQCYSVTFLLVVVLNTAVISLAAVVTMLSLENGDSKKVIRFGLLYFGFSIHLLYNMSPGQRVRDSSVHVKDAVFHCDWYNVSARTKRLVQMIMMRCRKPSEFTALNMITMNLENFMFVFSKSISYVTLIGSMR